MTAGGVTANRIAKWDDTGWSALGSGMNASVWALTDLDDGGGPALYAGGDFTTAGGVAANRIAKWDGTSWSAVGSGMNDSVRALAVFDDGNGAALYAGGYFTTADGVAADRIAKWDGTSWSAVGSGMNDSVHALAVFDDGDGPALYAGGTFTNAGGSTARRIAKWDGSSWSRLGGLINSGTVHSLTVFDDGSGAALHVGGTFPTAGGFTANNVARWDGAVWSALGSGVNGLVRAMIVFDDGGGPTLLAGGGFTTAGGVAADRIAQWDGTSWSALESGVNGTISALTVFDDGSGSAPYAGGSFTTAGGETVNRIAKWDGSDWSALGVRINSGVNDAVHDVAVFDDGSGPALYAGGDFTVAGGSAANRIAKCPFSSALDSQDSYLAKWGRVDTTPPTLSHPAGLVVPDDRGTPPGEVVSFTVTASDLCDSDPSVVCAPPSGSFFPRGTTIVTCTATDAAGNQATSMFPVFVALPPRRR